jgi:hypothetical protein
MKLLLFTIFFALLALLILRKGVRDAEADFDFEYKNLIRFMRSNPKDYQSWYYSVRTTLLKLQKEAKKSYQREAVSVAWSEFGNLIK